MATVGTPNSWQARLMRSAISPRLAIKTLRKIPLSSIDEKQRLAVFDGGAVFGGNRDDPASAETAHRITHPQRLDECELAVALEQLAFERRRTTQTEDADEVGLDRVDAQRRGLRDRHAVGRRRHSRRCMFAIPCDFEFFVFALYPHADRVRGGEKLG